MRYRILAAITSPLCALLIAGCASSPELAPAMLGKNQKQYDRDMASCEQVSQKALDNPDRRNSQAALAVGSAIGAGLVGLVVASASNSADDKAVGDRHRNQCMAKKGYRIVEVVKKE